MLAITFVFSKIMISDVFCTYCASAEVKPQFLNYALFSQFAIKKLHYNQYRFVVNTHAFSKTHFKYQFSINLWAELADDLGLHSYFLNENDY